MERFLEGHSFELHQGLVAKHFWQGRDVFVSPSLLEVVNLFVANVYIYIFFGIGIS